jgi:tetratricopeptide (TPR) repeat protein
MRTVTISLLLISNLSSAIAQEIKFLTECPSLPAIGASSKRSIDSTPENVESEKLMTQAITLLRSLSRENVKAAIGLLEESVKLNPNNAMAFARLGAAHELSSRYADVPDKVSTERSWSNLSKALSLDPDLVFALNQLANTVIVYVRDYHCGEKIYLRALQIEPKNADVHFRYAQLLGSQGRFKEAFEHSDMAILYADSTTRDRLLRNSGMLRYMAHDYTWVLSHYDKLIAANPNKNWTTAHFLMGYALAEQGKFDQALSEHKLATPSLRGDAGGVAGLARAYVQAGDTLSARKALQELLDRYGREEHVVEYQIATVYEALGEDEQVFQWLNKSLDKGDGWLLWLNHDPRWNRLRNDGRFKEVIARAKL